MRGMLIIVLGAVSGCNVAVLPDGGIGREVRVRPVEAALTSSGVAFELQRGSPVRWWVDGLVKAPGSFDSDGASIFAVPPGPALFEYEPGLFVYSAAQNLEPCGEGIRGGTATRVAGVTLDLWLSQPAASGDTLEVTSTLMPWLGNRLLAPDAGAAGVNEVVGWGGKTLIAGNTSVLHRSVLPVADGFSRSTTVGMLDAGLVDQLPDTTVALQGRLVPVAQGPDVLVPWDDDSLDAMSTRGGTGGIYRTSFTARRGGLPIAEVATPGRRRPGGTARLSLPALTPELFRVEGGGFSERAPGVTFPLWFGWQGPWTATPEMKLRNGPPREVRVAADGASVRWQPPESAPGVYTVRLLSQLGEGFESVALIVTEQTTVPLPLALQRANLFVEVVALYGAGLNDAQCVFQYQRLETWARLPAISLIRSP